MAEFNNPRFDNTYRLEPKETDRFYPSKVRDLIEAVITKNLNGMEYEHSKSKQMAEKIAEEIKATVKGLSIPSYKIVV